MLPSAVFSPPLLTAPYQSSMLIPPLYPSSVPWMLKHSTSKSTLKIDPTYHFHRCYLGLNHNPLSPDYCNSFPAGLPTPALQSVHSTAARGVPWKYVRWRHCPAQNPPMAFRFTQSQNRSPYSVIQDPTSSGPTTHPLPVSFYSLAFSLPFQHTSLFTVSPTQ